MLTENFLLTEEHEKVPAHPSDNDDNQWRNVLSDSFRVDHSNSRDNEELHRSSADAVHHDRIDGGLRPALFVHPHDEESYAADFKEGYMGESDSNDFKA